jgi:acetolactate synthase I/II/III large subunit
LGTKLAEKITGAKYFVKLLESYGVTHVFFMDAVLRRALAEMEDTSITRILGHTEKGVGYMADGYARVSGKPGICMAQSVGAANLAASLQDPYLGHSPVIAFTGRHVAAMQYRNAYQEVDHLPLFQPVTKFNAQIEVVDQLPHLIRQAFRESTTATPRPSHLDIAGFTGDALTPLEVDFEVDVDHVHTSYPAFRPQPDPVILGLAINAIQNSKKPIIIADRGAVISGARASLHAFASKCQIPITVTLDAKSLILEEDELFRGMAGLYGRSCTNHMIDEADLVIYLGSNTSDHTTANWKLPKPSVQTIQIDMDPVEIGRNYPKCIGIQADVDGCLKMLAKECVAQQREEWLSYTKSLADCWWNEQELELSRDATPMHPQRLCQEITDILPKDAILVADTGYSALWSGNFVKMTHSDQFYMRAAGSLGWSFPAAIGAKAAAPQRTVVCFTGDGGFSYHLTELETAKRWGLNVIVIVNNNECLSQGLKNLNIAYGNRPEGRKKECYVYEPTDFANIAKAFNCFGITVEKPEDFKSAFAAAIASNLPAVIDVKTEFAYQAQLAWVPS